MDSVSGIVADCVETTDPATDPESVVDFLDNDGDFFIDEDCFGSGEIVVTEYYSDSSGSEPDWFELVNIAWFPVFLDEWTISDGTNFFTIDSATSLSVLERVIFCGASTPTDTSCLSDWSASSFDLVDLDGTQTQSIVFNSQSVIVDTIDFSGAAWSTPTGGTSLQLDATEMTGALPGISDPDNDNDASWCETDEATDTWSAGTATPDAANQTCP